MHYSTTIVDTSKTVPEEVESLLHSIFPDEGEFSIGYVRGLSPEGAMTVHLFTSQGEVAGFAVCLECGSTTYLLFLGICEGFRNQGIASAYVENLITENPGKTLLIDCHSELIPFYKRFGFMETGYRLEYEGEWFEIITYGTLDIAETTQCMKWIGTDLHHESGLFDPSGNCILGSATDGKY